MQRDEIIEQLLTRKLFGDSETLVLTDGLEDAFLGVTATVPTKAIYDYWKCLDIIVKSDDTFNFDDSIDYLEKLIKEDVGEHSPLYIKKL